MKTTIFAKWAAPVAVLLVAIGGLFVTSASSAGATESKTETTHLTEVTAQTAFVGNNPQMIALGDRIIYSNDLFDNGNKVGHDAGYCEFIAVAPRDLEALCLTTLVLDNSQLVTTSLFTAQDELAHKPIAYAITGGTGKFLGVRGVVTRVQLTNQAQLTISLTLPT